MGIIFSAIKENKVNANDYDALITELRIAPKMLLEKTIKDNENVRNFVRSKLYSVLKTGVVPYNEKYKIYYNSQINKSSCIGATLFYDLIDYKGDLSKL